MEDTATAEISRAQVWQWRTHHSTLADGRTITDQMVVEVIDEELAGIAAEIGHEGLIAGRYAEAREIFEETVLSPDFLPFLTEPAYERL
jgi:malate synthase